MIHPLLELDALKPCKLLKLNILNQLRYCEGATFPKLVSRNINVRKKTLSYSKNSMIMK